jgi:peptidyl-prolyl cis-trans isomerase C
LTAADAVGYGTRAMMRLRDLGTLLLASVLAGCAGDGGESGTQPSTTTPAAPSAEAPGGSAVIARYAGKELTAARVQEAMKRLPGPSRVYLSSPERKQQFLDNLIVNDLMYEEGRKQGVVDDPDIRRQVDDFKERLVVQRIMRDLRKRPDVSDEEAKQQYDANPNLYSTTQIRASHILLKDEATAKEVRATLLADPAKFSDLAKEKSADLGSGRRGGELGLFGPGRMVPEFERVAFALGVDEISEPVKTQYGYHLIKVTERKEGTIRPFEQVKAQIKSQIGNQRLQAQLDRYMADLRQKADIRIDEQALAALQPPPNDPAESANPHARMGH